MLRDFPDLLIVVGLAALILLPVVIVVGCLEHHEDNDR